MAERAVVDASAMVELLVGTPLAAAVRARLQHRELHAPGHFDAEVLSALGRLHRAGSLTAAQVQRFLERLASAPIVRHELGPLLLGTWELRHNLRPVDALYAELAGRLQDVPIVTTDGGFASAAETAELLVQ